jgi:hypothetical protein
MIVRCSVRHWQKHRWEDCIRKMLSIAATNETILTRLVAKADKVEKRLCNLETRTNLGSSEYKHKGIAPGSVVAKAPELDLSRCANRRSILH